MSAAEPAWSAVVIDGSVTEKSPRARAGGPGASSFRVRPAEPSDVDLLFAWRNHPEIVNLGLSGRTVSREEHRAWFDGVLSDPRRLLLIALFDDVPAGQIRFDPTSDTEWEVSVYLVDPFRGRGLGTSLLQAGCREAFRTLPAGSLSATVLPGNDRSLNVFRRTGFVPAPDADTEATGTSPTRLVLHRTPEVPHNRLTVTNDDVESVASVVTSRQWTGGDATHRLEAALAERAGVGHAVCVASGSSALRLALAGLGIGPGAAVAVPAYSCVALANAVLGCGARVVPTDVTPGSWNIDHTLVRSERESAVIAVHTFGMPAPVGPLQRAGAVVIEDCAHAFGADGPDGLLGGTGAAGVLSFHATKLVGAGEGGAVLTDDAALAAYVHDWRDYDERAPDARRTNHRMSDLEAALAHSQLRRLDSLLAARRSHAQRYHDLLAPAARTLGRFSLPEEVADRVWYRYAVEVPGAASEVVEALAAYGVQGASPVTDWRPAEGDEPIADRAFQGLVSLPLYPTLTIEEQDRVVRFFLAAVRDLGSD